jgi:hypothetical protein
MVKTALFFVYRGRIYGGFELSAKFFYNVLVHHTFKDKFKISSKAPICWQVTGLSRSSR